MKKGYIATALILCAALALGGCGKKEEEMVSADEKASAVETMVVKKTTIESEYVYSGKVKPINEVPVLSTVSGKVATVNFDVGDTVKAGDVLFSMDTADIVNNINVLRASLATAEANISSARTTLEYVNGAQMQSQIESAKAGLSNAETAYNNAKTTYENNKTLYESGVVSKTAFDQIEMSYKQAETAYNQAKQTYDIMVNQMPAENLEKAQAGVEVAEASKASILAQIESAEKTLRDANVTSPISGVVTGCNVKAGAVLTQTAAAPFTIIDMSKINIDVSVSEQIINSLAPGQTVDVKVASVANDYLKGTISTVNPAASQAGTYDVKIEMDNTGGLLKSGMFGEVHFTREKNENTIVLPRNTVIEKNDEIYVFVDDNGSAKKVAVTTGIDNGEEIEITSGLSENMKVVIKGQTYLSDGDKIKAASNADDAKEE